jgi:2C-methyl-D-erythritol 2,4-cyclodiphosphate synthase
LDFGVIKAPNQEPKAQKEVRRKTMAKQTTYTGMVGDWQTLHELLTANSAEIPQVEPFRTKLGAMLAQAMDITRRQAGLKAEKQEMSKQLRKLAGDGQRLASAVRILLKEHYGIRDEKLSAYGLQPFRGRPRKAVPAPQETEPATPPTPQHPTTA